MAINLIKADKETMEDKKTRFLMTKSPEMVMVKDIEDKTVLDVEHFCFYEEITDEKTVSLLSIMDKQGFIYTTQSETFIDSFLDILDLFTESVSDDTLRIIEEFQIKKLSGVTKAGRDFVNCTLEV